MTRVEKNAEELSRKDVTMNDFKSKLDDLLDELERCCAIQHFEVTEDVRAEIHEMVENNIPQWHKLTFRPLTDEEKEEYRTQEWTYMIDGLPEFGEDVIVTNGTNAWVDSFDMDDCVYLSGTYNDIDGVIAWMEIPSYKEEK